MRLIEWKIVALVAAQSLIVSNYQEVYHHMGGSSDSAIIKTMQSGAPLQKKRIWAILEN